MPTVSTASEQSPNSVPGVRIRTVVFCQHQRPSRQSAAEISRIHKAFVRHRLHCYTLNQLILPTSQLSLCSFFLTSRQSPLPANSSPSALTLRLGPTSVIFCDRAVAIFSPSFTLCIYLVGQCRCLHRSVTVPAPHVGSLILLSHFVVSHSVSLSTSASRPLPAPSR